MTPTTILIEREADAKVFEVLEQLNPMLRWKGSVKPTEFKLRVALGKYVIVIKDDVLSWDYSHEYPFAITATEWLAQHGYVWDGDGYKIHIETPIHPAVAQMNADPDFLKKPENVKMINKIIQEAYKTVIKPVSAPTRTELEREVIESKATEILELAFAMFQKKRNGKEMAAPYTAGQEVEVEVVSDYWETRIFHHEYGGKYYCIHHDKPDALFGWDRIRPVQVQPEVPEWECRWREQFWRLIKAYKFEDSGRQLEVDSAIEMLRPLITPKQVTITDQEIYEKYQDLVLRSYSSARQDAVEFARWALQKAEGGEG